MTFGEAMTAVTTGKKARVESESYLENYLFAVNGFVELFYEKYPGRSDEYHLNISDTKATDWQIQNEDGTWESELVPLCRMAANRTETSREPVVNPI